jgi:hypothetical protein
MLVAIDLKVRQMHEAMGAMQPPLPDTFKSETGERLGGVYRRVDFNQGRTPADLANVVSLVLANIGCLKDHLKAWCASNDKEFSGEALINTNRDVALVHDLWNTDKHASLNRSRSGFKPQLVDLRQYFAISAGTEPGACAVFQMDMATGKATTTATGGGAANMLVSARIVDHDGSLLGELSEVCGQAVDAWQQELLKAGVVLSAGASPT